MKSNEIQKNKTVKNENKRDYVKKTPSGQY